MNTTTLEQVENSPEPPLAGVKRRFEELSPARKLGLMVAIAAVVALIVGSFIWSREPEYKALYSNLSDKDGGDIIESLQKLNIPYKMAEGGGAILVPSAHVYEARLKLASQGLPKGGAVGFDLMDNMKIGVTQFQENVAYQRALEGEITRTIEAISSVKGARVHLAMPKETVFVREQQKPSASILVNLYPGRALTEEQVQGIVHLVASSVPQMPPANVTIVDQDSKLLTVDEKKNPFGIDSDEMEYQRGIEQSYIERIESILVAITGQKNVKAQVAADIDFSQVEQTSEVYKPNQAPDTASVRSMQTSETLGDGAGAAGVPGALSNQPPGAATAPIVVNQGRQNANQSQIIPLHKEATTNFEVDKTVSHIKKQVGVIKRLSVAVVVNHKPDVDKKGNPIMRPLSKQELTQVYNLSKEAMGFNALRGDTLNVVNAAFSGDDLGGDVPIWKDPDMQELAKDIVKYLLIAGLVLYLIFAVIKPAVYKMLGIPTEAEVLAAALEAERLAEEERMAEEARKAEEERLALEAAVAEEKAEVAGLVKGARVLGYEEELEMFKALVREDPKIVANVMKDWVNKP